MKFAYKSLIVAASLVAAGGSANAAVDTLVVGGSVTDSGWTLSGLTGTGTLSFSTLLISGLNTAQVSLTEVSPATLNVTSSTTSTGVKRYITVNASAPASTLTGSFDGTTLTVQNVTTTGGASMATVKNSATTGAGSLSITNLKVDLTTKTVYADISGGNGLASLTSYALWTYTSISGTDSNGNITFSVSGTDTNTFTSTNTITGLFLKDSADIDNIFVKALALNSIGRSAIVSVNDPTKGSGAGFGTIVSVMSAVAKPVASAVPEPSTYALMGLGLVGISLVARRRA